MNVFFFQKVAIQMLKCYPNFPIEDDATPTNCLPARKVFSLVLGRLICKIFSPRLRLYFIENIIYSCLIKKKINLLFIRLHLISVLKTQEKKNSPFLFFFQLHCSLKNSEQCNYLILFTCLRELFIYFSVLFF